MAKITVLIEKKVDSRTRSFITFISNVFQLNKSKPIFHVDIISPDLFWTACIFNLLLHNNINSINFKMFSYVNNGIPSS